MPDEKHIDWVQIAVLCLVAAAGCTDDRSANTTKTDSVSVSPASVSVTQRHDVSGIDKQASSATPQSVAGYVHCLDLKSGKQ
jgi:hypothetical protein